MSPLKPKRYLSSFIVFGCPRSAPSGTWLAWQLDFGDGDCVWHRQIVMDASVGLLLLFLFPVLESGPAFPPQSRRSLAPLNMMAQMAPPLPSRAHDDSLLVPDSTSRVPRQIQNRKFNLSMTTLHEGTLSSMHPGPSSSPVSTIPHVPALNGKQSKHTICNRDRGTPGIGARRADINPKYTRQNGMISQVQHGYEEVGAGESDQLPFRKYRTVQDLFFFRRAVLASSQ